jgi:hypothetical protein
MKIEDCTQTKDRTPVRIYATDGMEPYPVHGAMKKPGGWTIELWAQDGRCMPDGPPSGKDLDLHDWKDEIPWEWIKGEWITKDSWDRWFAWPGSYKPFPSDTGFWDDGCGNIPQRIGPAIKMPTGPADWRQAIAKRPEGR